MDKNVLFLINQTAVDFAKKLVEKADDYGMYDADHSTTRTFRLLISELKYEYEFNNELYKYEAFIADLLGTMLNSADEGIYENNLDAAGIMAELPYMSIFGIQKTIMENSSNIALFEMVYDEYTKYEYEIVMKKTGLKFVDMDVKKEDDEEFLLKKIDVE